MRIEHHCRFIVRASAVMGCLALPVLASATPPTDQFGSFASTCGGVASGAGLPVSNIDLAALFLPAESVCQEDFDPAMGRAKAKVNHSGPRGTGGGTGQAQPGGKLKVRASNNSVGDGSEAAGALAGFTDVLTLNAPGLSGEPGILYYKVHVKGTLETHGLSGGATFRVLPLSPRGTVVFKDWSVGSDIVSPDAFLAVDESAVVAVSLVFGEPFTLTTVAWAQSSIRAQGGTAQGVVAFDGKNAVRLQGVDRVTRLDGTPIANYTLTSQAGLPW